MSNDDIRLTQREGVFVEGKRAFQAGKWRSCNPYTASSSILGTSLDKWLGSRPEIKSIGRTMLAERDLTTRGRR